MFCRNCGESYVTDEAIMCVKCGAPKGQGVNYCQFCGKPVHPESIVCTSCGVALAHPDDPSAKSKIVAGLLGIFLGCFGVHNFYLGFTNKAVLQLVLTIVGLITSCIVIGVFVVLGIQIWAIVEGIMILCGKMTVDASGKPLKD